MGNYQSTNNDQFEDGASNQLKISVDFQKPVVMQLKPLLHWSLQEIRQIYGPFRQRKGSPLLSRSQFLRLMSMSRIMSFHLFNRMCQKRKNFSTEDQINVFEIISILVLTSYTNYTYKIHCIFMVKIVLFNVFDLDSSRGLEFTELILSFKSLIRGYCILTDQVIPDNYLLEKYGQVMFSRADLNNDQCLQLGEVLNWFQGNSEGIDLFKRFQPKDVIGKEDYQIFNTFLSYTEHEIRTIYHRIQKQYKNIPLIQGDYELLTVPQLGSFKRTNSRFNTMRDSSKRRFQSKDSNFKTSRPNFSQFGEQNVDKQKKVGFSILTTRVSKEKTHNLFPNFGREASILQEESIASKENIFSSKEDETKSHFRYTNSISNSLSKVPSSQSYKYEQSLKKSQNSMLQSIREKIPIKQFNNTNMMQSQTFRQMISTTQNSWQGTKMNLSVVNEFNKPKAKKKFQNIIILKGKTVTKRQIFDLRDYFENLSCGKKSILIENFLDSFNDEKYNHMKSVAASLFNFLDVDQNGKVTFKELVQKLYPDLTAEQFEIIKVWNNEYNQNFNLSKKIKTNREHEELKKRVLPRTCITRYKEMFNFFDKGRKGYVDLNDLRRVLSDVSTEKQLIETFEDNDKNKDGKLDMKEFMHILLPMDLEIQGV